MTEKVLVTGAMGQLGTYLCQLLLERGHRVVRLDLKTDLTVAAAQQLAHPRFFASYTNLLDADALSKVMGQHQPTVIVHLAAVISPAAYKNPRGARRVNVEGTRNLIDAAKPVAPFFIEASSGAVYGSRNPHRHREPVTADTPLNPIDCYGEDKAHSEQMVKESGLAHVTLRLGGIISPATVAHGSPEQFLLLRATPRDSRMHMIDARDAALAFANAVERREAIAGKTLLIGGGEDCMLRQSVVQDDIMEALGLGRLGDAANLPGNPNDDRGWGLTDWFDTSEAQRLLDFQRHTRSETIAWVAESLGCRRVALRIFQPVLLPLVRGFFLAQKRWERRGRYADPWRLISKKYGKEVLATTR